MEASVANQSQEMLTFDFQRFCVHDGPGIRTVVFLKGCPLRCLWCQNPESLSPSPQTAFYADRCIGCLTCQKACPNGAIHAGPQRINRKRCRACGRCAQVCPTESLRKVGEPQTPEALLDRVLADRSYFDSTDGGVTLSGGEPLLQPEACARFLSLCKQHNLSTVVETCGAVPWANLQTVAPFVDRFYYDLKIKDDALAKKLTGAPAARIFANARKLCATGAEVAFRIPVVPGHNDGAGNLHDIAAFVKKLGHDRVHLLSYHAAGESKIDRIQSTQPRLGLTGADGKQAQLRAAACFQGLGVVPVVEDSPSEKAPDMTAPRFSKRVHRLRQEVQEARPSICIERACLVTEYYKNRDNQKKPMIVQKAEALSHVLRNKQATVYDDELLVGCFSSKRVGGSILPELHGVAMLEDLPIFGSREVNPLSISNQDSRRLALEVFPFWSTRFLSFKAFGLVKAARFILDQLSLKRYVINETGGISHFVPDNELILRLGTSGLYEKARQLGEKTKDAEKSDFYKAVRTVCKGLEDFAAAYAQTARRHAAWLNDPVRCAELLQIAQVCERVPKHPARTLHEAFQVLVFTQIALNLESLDNSVSPGRLDQVLYPYYLADKKAGRIDNAKARELVGCYTVKMSQIVPVFSRRVTKIHGGMFNGQVVVVGGQDRKGHDATNAMTWFFLDAMDKLRMRQPNFHARIHAKSPPAYLRRLGEILHDGANAPSLMNDDVVVPMLKGRGMTLADALDYSPVGCVEPVSCGKTFGSTDAALVNVALPLEWVLGTKIGGAKTTPAKDCRTLDELLDVYAFQLRHLLGDLLDDLAAIERANAAFHPTPLTSMLLSGCLDSGIDSTAGGAKYNASGVGPVGLVDVADSLAAIEHVVFVRKLCSLSRLVDALKANFNRQEVLRGHLLRAPKYGNDDPAADRMLRRVLQLYCDALSARINTRGGPYLAGVYSVTVHQPFGQATGALPSGRFSGRPLANGMSPSNGADRLGPTASLNSAASPDLVTCARNGVNVNLKLDSTSLPGQTGARAIEGLIRGYFASGGMQVQINAVDPKVLQEARDDPDAHPWLLVRVSGYSAYFNDLSPSVKQEIIERSLHGA